MSASGSTTSCQWLSTLDAKSGEEALRIRKLSSRHVSALNNFSRKTLRIKKQLFKDTFEFTDFFPAIDSGRIQLLAQGRTYYYNSTTKETTWTKPLELASANEKESILRKKKETKRFFEDMEANIINKLKKVWLIADPSSVPESDPRPWIETKDYRSSSSGNATYNRVRTISSLDDEILSIMVSSRRFKDNHRSAESKDSPTPVDRISIASSSKDSSMMSISRDYYLSDSMDNDHPRGPPSVSTSSITGALEAKDDLDVLLAMRRSRSFRHNRTGCTLRPSSPGLKRRNSTGTIYLGTTMSTQDNQSTIQCVCAVIHMHMLEAAREGMTPHRDFRIFEDRGGSDGHGQRGYGRGQVDDKIPSISTIRDFFLIIFSKSQLESECIIMSLIYIERLMKETRGKLCLRPSNWKAILFACLVMASKVWDDMSMWNVDFSHVCPTFDLQMVNALELTMLEALKYLIKVSAGEYAKYYFHLRSMMSKLGLQEHEPSMLAPLDIKGARRLQLVTENYQEKQLLSSHAGKNKLRARSYTIVSGAGLDKMKHRLQSQDAYEQSPVGVGLEQIVHTCHVDADGQQHATPSVAKYRSLREFNSVPSYPPTFGSSSNSTSI